MNLSSRRSCSNHFFGNFLFFLGKLRKVTPLSLSFLVPVLQPGPNFLAQLNLEQKRRALAFELCVIPCENVFVSLSFSMAELEARTC